ncbi:MAG: response regulator [Gammaproteobacteria bacterium]|nr:response regulator [Gammaproteobacteria bacterium]
MGRVLVVDDQPHVLRVMRLALSRHGYAIETALNGVEALEKYRADPYSVVITDIDMPKMNGRELCYEILNDARSTGLAPPLIVVVSGRAEAELTDWTQNERNVEFMSKPLSLSVVSSRLREHFESNQESAA